LPPPANGRHPPARYGAIVVAILSILFPALSLRRRR
jgi:hypothetical protein